MIRDARVLEPTFVPNDVVHRTTEIDSLTAALDPIVRGEAGETTFLFGPSGTGKTCIAQHVADQFSESLPQSTTHYVNCWENNRPFTVLQELVEGFDQPPTIHRTSTPTDQLRAHLRSLLEDPYVAILDEVDQLDDKRLIYELHAISGLTMVLIANQPEGLFNPLDERLTSRLRTATRIEFDRYSLEELVAILQPRARIGLDEDVVQREQLELIADLAGGDARVAIETLRVAARQAAFRGEDTITMERIRDAVSDAESEIRQRNVEKLTADQQILYDILADQGEMQPCDLYEEYRGRAADPKTDRTLRNYLAKMEQYNLVEAHGRSRGRRYRPIQSE